MSDGEKKIKLDELPDEGGQPVKPSPSSRPQKKDPVEPRITRLKGLTDPHKVDIMKRSWHFDVRDKNYTWVGYVAILLILEFSTLYDQYLTELKLMNNNFFDVGGDILRDEFTVFIEGFIRHPSILIILAPFIFKFSQQSDYHFFLSFDGINTVRKVVPLGSKEMISRVIVKWSEIERVEKSTVDSKDVLCLYAKEGQVAQLIWHLNIDKKRAIKFLLRGMINANHALRVFLENEKEV